MCEELQEMTLFRRKKGPYSNLQVKKIPSAAVLQLDENKVAQQVVQTQDQDHNNGLTISITIILR